MQRTGSASARAKTRSTPKTLPGKSRKSGAERPPGSVATRIGHTVLPQKHELVCYECGFAFKYAGKLKDTYCSKCRKLLKVADYAIDGPWEESIKTLGTVDILPGGVVGKVSISALKILLAGDIEQASVKWCQSLELRPGAKFNAGALCVRELRVAEGGTFRLKRELTCRDIEVGGTLTATVRTSGRLRILPGGAFNGEFHGARLIVEDGAGLKAKIALLPEQGAKRQDRG